MATNHQNNTLRLIAPVGYEFLVERGIAINEELLKRLDQETMDLVVEASDISHDILTAALELAK